MEARISFKFIKKSAAKYVAESLDFGRMVWEVGKFLHVQFESFEEGEIYNVVRSKTVLIP